MIYKRLMLSLVFLVTIFGYISPIISTPATTRAPRPTIAQENVVLEDEQEDMQEIEQVYSLQYAIAFDLDDVLFRGIPFSTKVGSVRHISYRVIIPAIKQLFTAKGSMDTWRLICEQHGDEHGARHFKQMMLSKTVYKDTQDIIMRAHKKGYKLFLASNVSQGEIELQSKRLPEIFNCFTDGVKVDDAPGKKGLKKPSAAYFKELKRIMLEQCGSGVKFIFIDDKEENVQAARKEGFIGIHCKNPALLWKQLSAVGVRL